MRLPVVPVACLMVSLAACVPSSEQEEQLGDEYAAELAQALPLVDDPAITGPLQAMVAPLQRVAARQDIDWQFHFVNVDDVNAFAIPGGHIYVFRGLVERSGDYEQLAGVVGHEIGHVDLRHSAEQMGKRSGFQVAVGIVGMLLGMDGLQRIAVDLAANAVFAKFSRDDEREADSVAVGYLARAGIDPEGIPRMFRTLDSIQARDPNAVEQWFGSHPQPEERAANVARIIAASRLRAADADTREAHEAFAALREAIGALPEPPAGELRLP